MSKEKARDYLFDNYKALLIILVIIGHYIQPCYKNNLILYTTKYLIYAFHMPAFIFISGFFSKKDAPWQKAVQKVLIPYLAFQTIYILYYEFILVRNPSWTYAVPKFSLWYLLSLFVWKVITPYVKKIPHYFWISVILALIVGFIPSVGVKYSLSRTFVLYPYFLAGMLFDREKLNTLRTTRNRVIGIVGILAFTIFAAFFADPLGFRLKFLYGRESYASTGLSNIEGVLIRLLAYGIGFFFTYAVAILMTDKKTVFSKLGLTTMSIYLFHGLLFKFLERKDLILGSVNTIPETLLLFAGCVALAFLFSLKPFCKFVDFFAALPVEKVFPIKKVQK